MSQPTFEKTLIDFSFKVANRLYVPGKNFVYSPSSVSLAFGMLLEGADGKTCHEILTAMFDPSLAAPNPESVDKASTWLVNLVKKSENVQSMLSVANLVYSQKGFKLHPNYVKSLQDKYQAIGRELDFVGNNAGALSEINGDVNKATKGMISKLLDAVESDTKAILVNAIHFKAKWEKPFKKDATIEDGVFYLANGKEVKAPIMRSSRRCLMGMCSGSQMALLPYCMNGQERVYMAVVIPKDGSVQNYLAQLKADDFKKALKECQMEDKVEVLLPRFKIESTHGLMPTLKACGIQDVFGNGANLSKMVENIENRLQVSEVLQKAVIDVNEEGTEAAAATAIMMRMCAMFPTPTFHANRPFVYAIITEKADHDKHILFFGAVENPSN